MLMRFAKRNYNSINARLNAMKISLVHFYFYATSKTFAPKKTKRFFLKSEIRMKKREKIMILKSN